MSDFQFISQKSCKPLTETEKLQRFFNYILDFKLGQQQSYRIRETNNSKLKQHNHSTERDDQFLSQSSIPNIIISSQSLRISSSLRRTQEKQSIQKENLTESINFIHYGYGCDKCYTNPIVGQRYNCKLCDYDLCQSCYTNYLQKNDDQSELVDKFSAFPCQEVHEHPLTKVEVKSRSSINFKELLLSGRKQKSSLRNENNWLRRSENLHRSSK